ncbi:hypothetical protein LTR85_003006 [Meristemomyces frigidus]|nr:hypothetical protein LTR85_003006 [Meristemomyces frigidus]
MSVPTVPASSNADRKRLHITPFNPDLLERYVPSAIRPLASGISFHAVQTAPEKGFGYVELPTMEADKVKKKFNGSTLKGAKVRVEEARPEKKRKVEEDEDEDARKARKRAKKEKRKKEQNVIPGRELEEGRHIKRGWDDGADKKAAKKPKKSKSGKEGGDSINGKKLLFKTTIPPNAEPVKTKSKSEGKAKKEKTEKKERSGKEKRKAVVQEFANTQKPIISVDGPSTGKGVFRYEDGKGWVDAAGNVVEAERASKRPRKREPTESLADSDDMAPHEGPEEATSSKTPAEEDDEPLDDEGSSLDGVGEKTMNDHDMGSDWEGNGVQPVQPPTEIHDQVAEAAKPLPDQAGDDAEGDNEDDIEDEPDETAHDTAHVVEQPKEVHPLEALFKRPVSKPESATKPKPSPIDTSFNFFNSSVAGEDEEGEEAPAGYPPQTPHTKQDLEWRSLRSAAPTPDTAAIGRKFSFPFAHGDDDEDEDDDADVGEEAGLGAVQEDEELPEANQVPVAGGKEGQAEESEFRKWFYDNRGALNRGWKKRRREERKAKRQRENRRLSRKVV